MAREAKRQFLRIASNYTRLGATLVLGVILTTVQFNWLGEDGFGLIALLTATIGISTLSAEISRESLVRELAAWYRRDDERFLASYNAAYVLSTGAAVLTAVGYAAMIIFIPVLKISDEYIDAARIFAVAYALSSIIRVFLGPAMAMYVVREWFILRNLNIILMRANLLAAAGFLYWVVRVQDIGRAVTLFGVISAALNVIVFIVFAAPIIIGDRRLIPRPWTATRAAMREIGGTFSWNTGVIIAGNLHERVAAVIMNLVFGVWGNTVYGLALRMTSYVRMATAGMTYGVDASTARIAESGQERLTRLIHHSTRLHTLTAAPAAVLIWILAEPLFHLWVGRGIEDPESVIPPAATLVRIMVLGLAARAISDGWLRILYGAGLIHSYAPIVFFGGLANPALVMLLIWMLPNAAEYTAVGWAYTALFVIIHGWIAPARGARALGVDLREFLMPTVRPIAAAILALPGVLLGRTVSDEYHAAVPAVVAAVGYSAIYAILCLSFVLTTDERRRIQRTVRSAGGRASD